ncbi:MAG: cyclic nucleotide-binding domain-containing protein [Desulfobacteraceae bacterium]|jgi:CRP-like cAMP-binding protein|nr:cyclic nucleotide-binding domain-containing protein [Desulfobacteraceae bacterium]
MSGDVAFAGNLSFLNLGELLQLLGTTGSSGTVSIRNAHVAQPGFIYIDKGNPIHAANGSITGLDALFSLFGWLDGQFEFVEEAVTCEKTVTKSRMEIILDGLRLLDEGQVEVIGPATAGSKPTDTAAKSGSLPLIKGPLVDYSYVVDEESFYDGDEIVQEGNHGNWIWVILEGIAEIVKETPRGTIRLLRIGDGAFLGSVASLLRADNVRSATVTAVGNIQLGMLDSQLMTSELANQSIDYREFVRALDVRLKHVNGMIVDIYTGNKKVVELTEGKKPLIKQGQNEDRLFKITSGDAIVARETDTGIVPLAHLQKGDFLGHVPFLDMGNEPQAASIFASPNLKLAALDPRALQNEHEKLSSTLQNVLAHLATSISVTTLIACDYFKKSLAD